MTKAEWVLIQMGQDADGLRIKNAVEAIGRKVSVVSLKEWRCFMHKDRYLTGSLYAEGERALRSPDVPGQVIAYATRLAARRYLKMPPVWVIDVADTDRGLVVMEISDSSSVGFYEADHALLVSTISAEADNYYVSVKK